MSPNTTFLVPEAGPELPREEHPQVALGQARAEDLRRPLTVDGLAASWGLTVEELVADMTPEQRAALPAVVKARNIRVVLSTLRDGYGDAATSDVVRAFLAGLAQQHIISTELQAKADRARDAQLTCYCCHQVEPTTRLRNVGPDLSGTVCSPCASAIAAVLDERARKDKQRLGHAMFWLDAQQA